MQIPSNHSNNKIFANAKKRAFCYFPSNLFLTNRSHYWSLKGIKNWRDTEIPPRLVLFLKITRHTAAKPIFGCFAW